MEGRQDAARNHKNIFQCLTRLRASSVLVRWIAQISWTMQQIGDRTMSRHDDFAAANSHLDELEHSRRSSIALVFGHEIAALDQCPPK